MSNKLSAKAVKELQDIAGATDEINKKLEALNRSEDELVAKAKKRAELAGSLLKGAGDLATTAAGVVESAAKALGVSSGRLEEAINKIKAVAETFKGTMEFINKGYEQLQHIKEFQQQLPSAEGKASVSPGEAAAKGVAANVVPKGAASQAAKTEVNAAAKAAASAIDPKLLEDAAETATLFHKGKALVGSTITSITGFFTGSAALLTGLLAAGVAAVGYLAVKFDEAYNRGRVVGAITSRFKSFFGLDQSDGKINQEDAANQQKTIDKNTTNTQFSNARHKEVRNAQRDLFASRGQGKEFDQYDLKNALAEKEKAVDDRKEFLAKGSSPEEEKPLHKERVMETYEHVKEAQEHILQTTRETTRELESQLSNQRQQVAEAAKLVEVEKSRFEGRKAEFAQLPEQVRKQLADIGRKIGTGKDITDTEAGFAKKYGFFNAAVTKHYAAKVKDGDAAALAAGGESGVATAVNALKQAKENEEKIQKALTASVAEERKQTEAVYATRVKIQELMNEFRFGDFKQFKLDTSLPDLGNGSTKSPAQPGQPAKPAPGAAAPQHKEAKSEATSQTVTEFKTAFEGVLKHELVPAILSLMSRTAANLNNASTIA